MDAQNAPTAPWKTTEQVFHSYHRASSSFTLKKSKKQNTDHVTSAPRFLTTKETRYNDPHSRRLIDNTDVLRRFAPITMDWNE
jgi:hypothetical protein